jgi:antitoxin VapB
MGKVVRSRTFKSGNGVAICLPEEFGLSADVEVELVQHGDVVTLRPKRRLTNQELVARLRELGPPADGVQEREPFEWPDRPGL